MNKQENKLAPSVLTTLISGIALIYTLIMYHDIIFAVMGMSLIFLICAYILTQNIIAFTLAKNKTMNSQLKEYIDDISGQLTTMQGSQSQLGKATFLYTKQTAQTVAALENNYLESQEALYKNLSSIHNTQNKATKLMIKYDQSNTTKVISTIKELRNQLSDTMIQGFDQLQPDNSEIVKALEDIVSYLKSQPAVPDQTLSLQLNNVAHELQNISNNMQHLQIPIPNVIHTPYEQHTTPVVEATPKATISEDVTNPEPMTKDITVEETVIEEPTNTDTIIENTTIEEITRIDAVTEDIITAEPVIENTTIEEPVIGDTIIEESPLQESTIDEADTEEQLTDNTPIQENITTEPVTEDPNKQLSSDEIAALFAAAEPTPKKEVTAEIEEEKPFTPTFTVVRKSDEHKEENEPMTIGDLSEDPNKQLSADEIAALFAAADPAPKKEEKATTIAPTPTISEDPNKQLSADEIAALFAAAEPTPKKDASDEERLMDEAIANATPEPVNVSPVSEDPNKQLSADEIAALFASLG